jgi:hypothetical protein
VKDRPKIEAKIFLSDTCENKKSDIQIERINISDGKKKSAEIEIVIEAIKVMLDTIFCE